MTSNNCKFCNERTCMNFQMKCELVDICDHNLDIDNILCPFSGFVDEVAFIYCKGYIAKSSDQKYIMRYNGLFIAGLRSLNELGDVLSKIEIIEVE